MKRSIPQLLAVLLAVLMLLKDCTGRTSSSTPHWTSGPA